MTKQLSAAILLLFLLFAFTACQNKTIDQLRPETVHFLEKQEKARCACLEQHGDNFVQKMQEGIKYIQGLPDQYDLNNLSPKEHAIIEGGLAGCEGAMLTVMSCIQLKVRQDYQSDQLTQMLIAEDLRVVLELDSAKTETERTKRINIPTLELMDSYCPTQKEAVLQMQKFLEVAEILPPELQ